MPKKRTVKDPRYPQFWDDEEAEMWDQLAPAALKILFAGAVAGSNALPAGMQVLVNWDVFNHDAVDWLRSYRLDWIKGINDTTRTYTQKVIEDWVRSGEHLDVLTAQLAPIFGDERARR